MRRWTENWTWFVDRLNITADLHGDTFFRVTFEQSVFRDATCSAMLQRPRFYHRCASESGAPHSRTTCTQLALHGVSCLPQSRTLLSCCPLGGPSAKLVNTLLDSLTCSLSPRDKERFSFPWWDTEWRERHSKACRWWNKTEALAVPEPWQPFARTDKQAVKHVSLQLPYSHGEYPEEWGRTPFPPERGPYSTAFQQWLRRDVESIWVDVDTPTDPSMLSRGLAAWTRASWTLEQGCLAAACLGQRSDICAESACTGTSAGRACRWQARPR